MKNNQLEPGLSAANATKHTRTFKKITIAWPADLSIPTPRGKWMRLADGRILATYTPQELAICLKVLEVINAPEPQG